MSIKIRILLTIIITIWVTNIHLSDGYASVYPSPCPLYSSAILGYRTFNCLETPNEIIFLNKSLYGYLKSSDYVAASKIVNDLEQLIINNCIKDTNLLSESCFYVGTYYNLFSNYNQAITYLTKSILLKEQINAADTIYTKALYNLGSTYSRLGNFDAHKNLTIRAIEVERKIYGTENHKLISTYASLITAYIELKEYSSALDVIDVAYKIADMNSSFADPRDIAFLYNNIGVLYNVKGDYTKSRIFLEKAEEYYNKSGSLSIDGHINLLLAMSNSLKHLGELQKSEHYYKRGIEMAMQYYSLVSYQLLYMHAIKLGSDCKLKEGESVLSNLLSRVIEKEGKNSQSYYEVLAYYANFLRIFGIDRGRAHKMYSESIEYFDKQGNSFLYYDAKVGYALILSEEKEYVKSLEILQTLLFPINAQKTGISILDNPDAEEINADKDMLEVLQTKYQVLKKYNFDFPDQSLQEASSGTAELIIALLDRIRISISEEESRLLLGDRYRNSYLIVINDFYNLYKHTGNEYYFEKAFEYTEKSKIASLLTATRELKAIHFHIPEELAEKERQLQSEIALLNDRISGKSFVDNKTNELIQRWKDNLITTIRKRDSLVNVFEKDYPGYYSIKYNTRVISPSLVPEIAGKNSNYLSYVVSDTNLFLTVINKKYRKIVSVPIDSGFFQKIREFRRILSAPDFDDAREDYMNFQKTGYAIFYSLIAPIKDYLISDRILISPDNLLSYMPFETLPVENDSIGTLSYKDITFMMEEYDISYTYSATFLAENLRKKRKYGSTAIAFAPDYSDPVNTESLFQKRQKQGNLLHDLPYARTEAEYVSKLFGGKLLLNASAKESEFKKEAPKFDIIHLAMHTVLDDDNPMSSTLIFSPDTSGEEDRLLRTFEIYNIPLNARMVVLSSCNTGTGKLFSGEGILSLARGFIYSGSESVVMSMWEIEDRAGTDIVKLYYDYLKRGYSKSISLRKARIDFLSKSDQLRAHPYFWSALVVYGDNSPLIKPFWHRFLIAALIIITVVLFYYVIKRRYS